VLADYLKGLIKLAAAGVKAREGQPVGVKRHARRAAELFQSVSASQIANVNVYAGLMIEDLIHTANSFAAQPVVDETRSIGGRPVLSCRLTLID
jgi:hypothetical protein